MKNLLLFCLLTLSTNLVAQESTLPFMPGTFSDLLAEAKKQSKPLLLYFHFDGCGACRKMEKEVFVDTTVQNYYESAFLCYSINTLKEDGPQLKERYNVTVQPAFVFASADGEPKHKVVGTYSADEFISAGKNALNGDQTLYRLRAQYMRGDRDAGLLYKYIYALRDAYEDDPEVVRQYLQTQTLDDLYKPENIKLIYEFFLIRHDPVFTFSDPAFQFMAANRPLFEQFFKREQINVRLIWAIGQSINQAAMNKDEVTMHQIAAMLEQYAKPDGEYFYEEMDGRQTGVLFQDDLVGSAWMQYYRLSGNMTRYNELLDESIRAIWDNWKKLNEEAWARYMAEDDPLILQKAIRWAERSLELKPTYMNTDTYAALLFKTKQYDKAEETALKAIELGKTEGSDINETESLLGKIRDARNAQRE